MTGCVAGSSICQGFMVSNGQTVTCDGDDNASANLKIKA